jgi:hypothetical protein
MVSQWNNREHTNNITGRAIIHTHAAQSRTRRKDISFVYSRYREMQIRKIGIRK